MNATLPHGGDPLVVACDESGSSGENLMGGVMPVFVHGSTNLTLDEAETFMEQLRSATGSRAREVKSSQVLRLKHRPKLVAAVESIASRGNLHLVDKFYYVATKLVDLLIAAQAAQNEDDGRFTGEGRLLASMLVNEAPADLGPTFWRMLLRKYNEFVRVYARANQVPPTIEPFIAALRAAMSRATNPRVQYVLGLLWNARHFAAEYEGTRTGEFREMDPAFSTLAAVAKAWRIRLGDVPFEFLIDTYAQLTDDVRHLILETARLPLPVAGRYLPGADLRDIRQTASHLDARVQVADIISGVGREIAALAANGTVDDDLQIAATEMLDLQGMWSDGSPLDVLYDRRPPQYARDIG
ncbi:hypothetical protein [Curtobacterium citreum]|uniref:hypothetical protein n=1 Tax=Curtobacterium citreum TaxID=2036 RepID=UPI0025436E15|nr:hypothetical protein [Curtobacterium citreum]WIJ45584.1 hypothetical protein QPK07_01090 [Curtobacterium citreum]